jgi:hypothetical protein
MKNDFNIGDKFKCKDQTLWGYWRIVDILYEVNIENPLKVSCYELTNGGKTIYVKPMHLKTFFRKVG